MRVKQMVVTTIVAVVSSGIAYLAYDGWTIPAPVVMVGGIVIATISAIAAIMSMSS